MKKNIVTLIIIYIVFIIFFFFMDSGIIPGFYCEPILNCSIPAFVFFVLFLLLIPIGSGVFGFINGQEHRAKRGLILFGISIFLMCLSYIIISIV